MNLHSSSSLIAAIKPEEINLRSETNMETTYDEAQDIVKRQSADPKDVVNPKVSSEEDKDDAGSAEEFSDEENEIQQGSKSTPGRGVTLQMLLEDKMLEPGTASMTIEYLGQKFVGDLQPDGKIKSHETETIFYSPSAWAIHCKRIINPDKRSGCGWASVKYKGKKLDTIKATYLRKKQIERENEHTDEEMEIEMESPPEPPPHRTVMKHNTIPNRMSQHDANTLIEAVSFSSVGKTQPFLVSINSNCCLVLDLHCHLKTDEVYGYLAGSWDLNTHSIAITHTFPCLISKTDRRPRVLVELEIQMEIEKLGLTLLGWYHSHPTNPAMPSLRDCDSQLDYQIKMRGPTEISYTPCIGIICSPYNPESPVLESSLTCFWVVPPPEQKPTEYPRPLLLQYNMVNDSHLSPHSMEQIKKAIKYYTAFSDETFVNFKDNFKPDITYLDKLKSTLTPKFPREQSDGLLWHFIRDELGCASEHDDKLDLDALLAVPQPIPVSKPSSLSSSPAVSTLQQLVSRPASIPPMTSSIGTTSPLKFDAPTQLNVPTPSSSKPSKSTTPLPSGYPTGLEMLTSMALGLGSGPLSMSGSGFDSLAAANSMLSSLNPGMSSMSSSKMADAAASYASSLNLSANYDKSSSSSTSTSSTTPIPGSIASNLMMSSADIANALFSATKYSNAGILGIPDPMSKSTLAANNMFLSPSLLKMQESLMKPLTGSSTSSSSKASMDFMKNLDVMKSSKDYYPPDFSNVKKGLDSHMEMLPRPDSAKSDASKSDASDYSRPRSEYGRGDSFLTQMLELTKKTTMPNYPTDYSQSPVKHSKTDESNQLAPSSHPYLSTAESPLSLANYSREDPMGYAKEQDYSMHKTPKSDCE